MPFSSTLSAIGIGDMGGDVFGNGMIEHKNVRLMAAFNHAHIFLDPDPDPDSSYRERLRLFKARYGGWDAYDTERISGGGGVFERHAKRIPLSCFIARSNSHHRSCRSDSPREPQDRRPLASAPPRKLRRA